MMKARPFILADDGVGDQGLALLIDLLRQHKLHCSSITLHTMHCKVIIMNKKPPDFDVDVSDNVFVSS